MLIFSLIICITIFVISGALVVTMFMKHVPISEGFQIIYRGFLHALSMCGFKSKKNKYPVDLWVWEVADDKEVCEDCLERASWAPMDIADWMKEGMPGTHEANTECGSKCRCKLAPYKPRKVSPKEYH